MLQVIGEAPENPLNRSGTVQTHGRLFPAEKANKLSILFVSSDKRQRNWIEIHLCNLENLTERARWAAFKSRARFRLYHLRCDAQLAKPWVGLGKLEAISAIHDVLGLVI
jgi:hypothetical protein